MDIRDAQGTARCVPPADDPQGLASLLSWINRRGEPEPDQAAGTITLTTTAGRLQARPGDWLILTIRGDLHVAKAQGAEPTSKTPRPRDSVVAKNQAAKAAGGLQDVQP